MPPKGVTEPPWSTQQVELLNAYQTGGRMHPFTCVSQKPVFPDHPRDPLLATPSGWICRHCTYTQQWAWEWMLNPEMAKAGPPDVTEEQARRLLSQPKPEPYVPPTQQGIF